jgi:4-hydroxy-tetrahydrodipicolinate reductase
MNILIIGNGRMGREIAGLASLSGHETAGFIDSEQDRFHFKKTDMELVAIEFSQPEVAPSNLIWCFENNIPVVCGTTGWGKHLPEITSQCSRHNGALIWSSNFSPGMNIVFEINRQLSKLMNNFPNYSVEIQETHHTKKLDAPSGTAISLASDIISQLERKTEWVNKQAETDAQLEIISRREGDVTGEHIINWQSEYDVINLRHNALNRKGFALGALLAAAWIQHRKGVFTMQDMLRHLSGDIQ